jgi:exonuclease III
MAFIYKVITLNINAIRAEVKKYMLACLRQANAIDIAMLQMVAQESIVDIPHYTAVVNLGPELRGTATLARDGLAICAVQRLPSGRGLAVEVKGVWQVNVYAPSEAERRMDREIFLNN